MAKSLWPATHKPTGPARLGKARPASGNMGPPQDISGLLPFLLKVDGSSYFLDSFVIS